jgi:transposase
METAQMTKVTNRTSEALQAPSHHRHVALPSKDIQLHESMAQPERVFLNNDEAAQFLNLSPRTLEKQRVIGGGPRFRKFGRRVLYAVIDLEAWANERTCESTSDPHYGDRR